ncbi:hypothetical protein BDV29DRAFT_168457 [Aspergillus leporis]|uniref:Uncharacterized protein n=1 Tax=Aspergillus leporis TaxID=41062 RepID=A0A5N5X9C9_9EURO|nr:hypothetical protein BDV29DRAFT_168457 [Aspergillus leporis]
MCFPSSKNDNEKYDPPRPSRQYGPGNYNSGAGYGQHRPGNYTSGGRKSRRSNR